jgi:hypothetical protein
MWIIKKLGTPKECPKCKMQNTSGLKLPEQCSWCGGTGDVDFGVKLKGVKR